MRLPPLPDFPRPLVFAHRGASTRAPENTRASFALAMEAGIPGIELDVHLSSDGELVVIHDHYTGRTAPGSLAPSGSPEGYEVEKTAWKILRELDAGSWKAPRFASERFMLLEELFAWAGERVYYDIELKSRIKDDYGLEKALAGEISRSGLAKRCLVSSFNPFALKRFKRFAPQIPTGIIWSRTEELPFFLRRGEGRWIASADYLKPAHGLAKPLSRLAWKLSGGATFVPWTVDSPEEARRLLSLGAEGLISNDPGSLGLN
jgi:glycerophosphoryl diester phosphodiesterase